MSKALIFIYAGGALHAGWAVFHLFFPRIFQWPQRLASLDSVNRSIMQVLNLCLAFYFAVAAYLSLAFAPELLASGLGKKLLAIFTAFWLLRLALQFRFFRAVHPASLVLILFFALTLVAYGYPLLQAGR
ncbi:MAG: hypothetical protein AB1814_11495 [Thermodesulfobacteriota bacterium]